MRAAGAALPGGRVLVSGFKSVVLVSDDPERTAGFYRDVLGLPLEEEHHRGTRRHWAGQVGAQHFAVHGREGFWLPVGAEGAAGTVVSFEAADVEAVAARAAASGVDVAARTRIGPMAFVALVDPDGRFVCVGEPWPG